MRRTDSNEAGTEELRKVKMCRQNAELRAQGGSKRAQRGRTPSVPHAPMILSCHDFVYFPRWWRSATALQ
jgi:hypothetical protein